MSLIMQPILADGGFQMLTGKVGGEKPSFASHFEDTLEKLISRNRDKLGVMPGAEQAAGKGQDKLVSLLKKSDAEISENEKAAAILGLFLQDMQTIARQKDMGPGEWEASITDREALKKLFLDAGMSEGQLGSILDELGKDGDSLNVASVLEVFSRHLTNMEEERITVPETRLPLLESILTRMGIDSARIREIAAEAVTGDNQLDLNKFLQGLKDIDLKPAELAQGKGIVKLSEWETKQLFDMLAEAGVDRSLRNKLLPELNLKNLFTQNPAEGKPEMPFNLNRMKALFQAGVENASSRQPEINIPRFMVDLEKVLGQATFNDKSAGWSKVVQETIESVFKDLQKMFDRSQAQSPSTRSIFQTEMMSIRNSGESDDQLLLSGLLRQSGEKGRMYRSKWFTDLDERKEFLVEGTSDRGSVVEQKLELWTDILTSTSNTDLFNQSRQGEPEAFLLNQTAKADNQSPMQIMQNARLMSRSPQQLQEQVMQQISSGVMRGLANRQHSLLLRLYPPEMGEVRVNLQVRNDHVSVTFNMENVRVKEILEGNMQNFRDSMSQKGFNLDECSVFVGQEGSSDSREQFGNLFREHTGRRPVPVEEEPIQPLMNYPEGGASGSGSEKDGISLIV